MQHVYVDYDLQLSAVAPASFECSAANYFGMYKMPPKCISTVTGNMHLPGINTISKQGKVSGIELHVVWSCSNNIPGTILLGAKAVFAAPGESFVGLTIPACAKQVPDTQGTIIDTTAAVFPTLVDGKNACISVQRILATGGNKGIITDTYSGDVYIHTAYVRVIY